MNDNEFAMCRCGHTEEEHHWKKITPYDGPETFSNPFTTEGFRGELRVQCRMCSCEKFAPPTKHKVKWFGIGIGIFVILAVVYRLFIAG